MFRFVKQIFIPTIMFFSSISSMNSLKCVSMNNQEFKVRPEIVNVCSNPKFYNFNIKINKCNSDRNNINDPYANICVPDTTKNLNIEVSNLISLTNETRHI